MATVAPTTQLPVSKLAQPPVQAGGVPQPVPDPYVASASAPQSTSYKPEFSQDQAGYDQFLAAGKAAGADMSGYSSTYSQPIQQGAPSGGGYATQTQINPASDLRSQQITPGADPRLATTQGQTDQAAKGVSDYQYQAPNTNDQYTQQSNSILQQALGAAQGLGSMGGGGSLNYGADTSALRAAMAAQSGNLLNGAPSREDLAAKQFALLMEQSNPNYEQDLRSVNRSSAAMGRQGAGMTTNDLGTVAQRRNEALSQAQRGLSYDSAGQQVGDRLSALQAALGGFNSLAGADQAQASSRQNAASIGAANAMNSFNALRGLSNDQFGRGSDLRSENRLDQSNQFNTRRSQLGDLSGLEQQQFGQGLTNRNELRGERGYQTDAAQQGIDNAVRQRMLEDSLQGTGFNRNLAEQGQLYDQGYAGDQQAIGAGEYQQAVNQQGANNTFGGINDMLSEYLRGKQPTIKPPPVDPSGQNWAPNPRDLQVRG